MVESVVEVGQNGAIQEVSEEWKNESTIRYTCDVPVSVHNRAMRYIKDDRHKNYWGIQAIEERVNRMEGRDKRAITEDRKKLAEMIREMVKDGTLRLEDLFKDIMRGKPN